MITVLLLFNTTIFTLLALLHFYWAIGGRWAYENVIPTGINGRPVFRPGTFGAAAVGAVFVLFAWADLGCLGWLSLVMDSKFIRYGLWIIAVLFLLRGIGDFRYVGITRQKRQTLFARMDAILYTPLCFFIGFSHAFIGMSY
ncbi:DUF3995 domain-containing protein [Pedobacter panaciterrae]|uniref:DUF3995 domain-containing protein n=1 Tax=Pedobacter panaciterrae TaxID=363849 RepID=UPI0025935525|nr:DUF3995 domain-containing protein [uncultured Pedobacter sp.]